MDPNAPPDVIIPPPPPVADDRDSKISDLRTQMLEAQGMIEGLQMSEAAAKRERDVKNVQIAELEAQLRTPCTLCGKQKLDSL